ncbi:hypothetical protein GCM10011591_25530 [Nocardia camponoti]|uniref:Uncharacterized protein n=1 Tax=Nocardia camponoti TaxID=1616106 RepID=A0A917V9C6_9NOCA|nr:hypothetical protein GCM10011591_25530 [Nocardia camponoti]
MRCYQREFGLPVRERGGFVMLPITANLCVVHLPSARAEKVLAAMRASAEDGPVLARHIRWSVLATPDERPAGPLADELAGLDVDVPGVGSAVMLPTSLGKWSREGCYWVRFPQLGDALPALSAVLRTAIEVGPQRFSTALSESGERGKFRYERDGVGPRWP